MLTVMKNSVPKLIDFCLEMMYRNMVRALMCLELILNAVNINFVTFSDFFDKIGRASCRERVLVAV